MTARVGPDLQLLRRRRRQDRLRDGLEARLAKRLHPRRRHAREHTRRAGRVPTCMRARLRDTLASVFVVSFHTDHCCLQSRTWAVGSVS